ncbi:hypothetical protein [Pseudaestuariivita atlantica]|uniref:hypothetical protein n=1 Tax=Pseudaestuariivita atlantica TaxID=1317121 RepID=UPI00106992A1|nr:hypothetical protein [Pseudaestuariivita atlantica]
MKPFFERLVANVHPFEKIVFVVRDEFDEIEVQCDTFARDVKELREIQQRFSDLYQALAKTARRLLRRAVTPQPRLKPVSAARSVLGRCKHGKESLRLG